MQAESGMLVIAVTGEQIRAARAFTRLEQRELAERAGVSVETIKRLERIRGAVDANIRTLTAISEVFLSLGVAFEANAAGVGVRRVAPFTRLPEVAAASSELHRVIYHSVAHPSVAPRISQTFDEILAQASRRNAAQGVTGALLCCDGRFLQHLEGPKAAVFELFGAIVLDPRHTSIVTVESSPIRSRTFSNWTMCCGLVVPREVVSREPAMAGGFNPEQLSPSAATGLLGVLRDYGYAQAR